MMRPARTCPRCHSGIQPNWVTCPSCGLSLGDTAVQKGRSKKNYFLLGGVAALVLLCLCGFLGIAMSSGRTANPTPGTPEASSANQTARPVQATGSPTVLVQATDFKVYVGADTNIQAGNWATLRVTITNDSPITVDSIHLVVNNDLFQSYDLQNTEPSVSGDHVEDKNRHLDFGPLEKGKTIVYKLNMTAKDRSPSIVFLTVLYNKDKKIQDYRLANVLAVIPHTPTPLTPPDQLAKLARDTFGERTMQAKLTNLEGVTVATVDFSLGAQWDENMAVRTYTREFQTFAPRAFSIGVVDVLELRAFAPFKDQLGNSKDEVAFKFTISRATAAKINWQGVEARNFGRILTGSGDGVYIHPALRQAWTNFQAGR